MFVCLVVHLSLYLFEYLSHDLFSDLFRDLCSNKIVSLPGKVFSHLENLFVL